MILCITLDVMAEEIIRNIKNIFPVIFGVAPKKSL